MQVVTSKDGTHIAYDTQGVGPAVILVAGALCTRLGWSGPHLSNLLAPHFTVYNYDRRGRGDSGDTKPYAVAREVEDIETLKVFRKSTVSSSGYHQLVQRTGCLWFTR
jgi:pimeloyl-ACP methyl ester carboxylesterase